MRIYKNQPNGMLTIMESDDSKATATRFKGDRYWRIRINNVRWASPAMTKPEAVEIISNYEGEQK